MRINAVVFFFLLPFFSPIAVYPLNIQRFGLETRCFKTSTAQIRYILEDYNAKEFGRPLGNCAVEFEIEKNVYSFYMRRVQVLRGCRAILNDWYRIVRGSRYVCVSGDPGEPVRATDPKQWPQLREDFLYDKIVTDKGCAGYFEGTCTINERIRL